MTVDEFPGSVHSLDVLVFTLVLLVLAHTRGSPWKLALAAASLALGLLTEQLSLRLGGTHCHASGIVNVSTCSSANSVFWYIPWVYTGVTCARRLTDERSWAFPLLSGMLFFGLCGVYEAQGPLVGWWRWPAADGLVASGCTIWQAGPLGLDARGLVASPHVMEALGERLFGVPVMAPYFHFAFGWGIAVVYQLTAFKSHALPVLLGPTIALVWDPAMRAVCTAFGASKLAAVCALMLGSTFAALALSAPPQPSPPRDLLLFSIPLLSGTTFALHAIVGAGALREPPELKLFVVTLALCATLLFARSCGLLPRVPIASTATEAKKWA